MTTITIYKTKLTPEKNARLDDMYEYLNRTYKETKTIQYIKHELTINVKLNLPQTYSFGANGYNYAYIKNSEDEDGVYYFIMDSNWKATDTVELVLSMDSVNSFWHKLEWSPNTKITRQHKDRFKRITLPVSGSFQIKRQVDRNEEGINPPKLYMKNSKTVLYTNNLPTTYKPANWYLIYKTLNSQTTTDISNPISIFATSDKAIPLTDKPTGLYYADYPAGTNIGLLAVDNPTLQTMAVNINGHRHYMSGPNDIAFNFYFTGNSIEVRIIGDGSLYTTTSRIFILDGSYNPLTVPVKARLTNQRITTVSTLEYVQQVFRDTVREINIAPQGASGYLTTINEIDRTDSRIMKIIELPYPPFEVSFTSGKMNTPENWTISDGMFKSSDFGITPYSSTLTTGMVIPDTYLAMDMSLSRERVNHNIKYESKLYNSEFYNLTFKYDSFEKNVDYERLDVPTDTSETAGIKFVSTGTINSNFLFDFDILNYNEMTDTSKFMYTKRNNEIPIMSNDYINYIRNGYNYDKKSLTSAAVTGLLNTTQTTGFAIATAGATKAAADAAAIAAGKAVTAGLSRSSVIGIAATAVGGIFSVVSNAVQQNRSIKQKLNELRVSPSSVTGADDLDLMRYSVGNKLYYTKTTIPEDIKLATYNLFRLTGYACTDYGVPNFNSRIYYNFVQCDPVFSNEDTLKLTDNIIQDIKARFRIGVTVFHYVDTSYYDLEQQYENFESWLI